MRGKLLLLGDHAVVYGRPCLVAAIDKFVTVKLKNKQGKESAFVAAARQLFEQKYGPVKQGFKIKGFSSQYGLGSSAAVTVAAAQACFKFKKIKVTKKQLFDFCYQVVKKVQGVGSGFDLAAAIYGGVVYFVTGGKKIERLAVKELPLVVGYGGTKADTATMIKKTAGRITKKFLDESTVVVNQARKVIVKKNWPELGKLMNKNQTLLKTLDVSTPKLDRMIKAASDAGAYGAKLSGAGGGDCIIVLVSPNGRLAVERAIKQASGKIIKVKLSL